MPKLTDAHIYEKLREQLADLKAGKEVEARKMKTILSDAQLKAIDDKWDKQQKLRAKVKARTKQQQIDAGYKSKREVQIEVYEKAVKDQNPLTILQKEMHKAEVRRAKIFMDSYGNAREYGKEKHQAENIANNDLTRAGLERYDRQKMIQGLNKRDREVFKLEEQLKKQLGINDDEEEDYT